MAQSHHDLEEFSIISSDLTSLENANMESYHLKKALPKVSRSNLGFTENFMWCEDDVLGQGTFGIVCRGFRKKDGVEVAVKKFNRMSALRPVKEQEREFSLLQALSHDNVVKLLAVERDWKEDKLVIITEFCNGESLQSIITDPENAHGLPEDDFLLVLEHLTAGIEYLKKKSVVHRDLKPANIMKHEKLDRSVLYKLIDFGNAKCVDDDEYFDSICGTTYYIHPKIHGCYLGEDAREQFPVTLELWSIGATLYNLATGSLPFRPCDMKDSKTLYLLSKNKPSGAISGSQKSPGSNLFDYSTTLPDTCLFSNGLKDLVTPIIARLMTVPPSEAWTFEEFFAAVDQVVEAKKRMVWCWCVNALEMLRLYPLNEDFTAEQLSTEIEKMTSISATHQILIHEKVHIKTDKTPVITTSEKPLFLFRRGDNKKALVDAGNSMAFPSMDLTTLDKQMDCSVSGKCATFTYNLKRQVDHISLATKMTNKAAKNFIQHIVCEAAKLDDKLKQFLQNLTSTKLQNGIIMKMQRLLKIEETAESDALQIDILNLNVDLEEHASVVRQLPNAHLNALIPEHSIIAASHTMNALVLRLKNSWHALYSNVHQNSSYKEEELFKLEKIRVSSACNDIKCLMDEDILPFAGDLAYLLSKWYQRAQEYFKAKENSEARIVQLQATLEEIQTRFDRTKEEQILSIQNGRIDVNLGSQSIELDRELLRVQQAPQSKLLIRSMKNALGQFKDMTELIKESKKINAEIVNVIENMKNGDRLCE